MNDDKQDPAEAERTIIRPAGSPPISQTPGSPPISQTPGSPPISQTRGLGTPGSAVPPPPADRTIMAPAAGAAALPGLTSIGSMAPMAPRTDGDRIQVGDVLNHIFEVKRFLARGGMGEVFEGINVNSDERVAIKVILPQLAADPNVQAMFRKEARTLTRLSHPALVQYRVLAQEPQLGVFYIVTEFIDGCNLSDVLTQLKPTPAELLQLTKRLAEGLAAAHALGAIHRDMSPDNVLLEDKRLDRARIIDFGIAKDLDPGSKTIIGDGFAGKLGYVAPEQLGDFDREVGPWSDVYSLGLLILAVAQGKNVDMGASFVEAIDRRRKGADTSAAPPEIRGILDQMLTPDPQARLRSMEAVVAAITAAAAPAPVGNAAKTAAKSSPKAAPRPAALKSGAASEPTPASNKTLIYGGVGGVALLLAVGGWLAFGGKDAPTATSPATSPVATGSVGAAVGAAKPQAAVITRSAVARLLPTLPCTWLDLTNVADTPAGVTMAFAGVAGAPAKAEQAISDAAVTAGSRIASTDFSGVAPISATECASIDAFRAIRADGTTHLSVPQRKFEMSRLTEGEFAGQIGATTVINLDLGDPNKDFALYGIEPNGAISGIIPDRKTWSAIPKTGPLADLGGDRFRLQAYANHSGWSGVLLLTGIGGFSDKLIVSGPGERTEAWRQKFAAAAAANGWKAEMVWFKMVDEVKD